MHLSLFTTSQQTYFMFLSAAKRVFRIVELSLNAFFFAEKHNSMQHEAKKTIVECDYNIRLRLQL